MSLSPIVGAASQLLNLFTKSSSSAPAASPATDLFSAGSSSGSVNLSPEAQFFSKLQSLSQSNPGKFKQLTAQIASQLQTAAQNATGSEQTVLTNLSNQFQTASQTGSAASLQPGHGHAHHGHHHESGYNAASQPADASNSSSSGVLQSIFQEVANA